MVLNTELCFQLMDSFHYFLIRFCQCFLAGSGNQYIFRRMLCCDKLKYPGFVAISLHNHCAKGIGEHFGLSFFQNPMTG